jgi:hypothetical protein
MAIGRQSCSVGPQAASSFRRAASHRARARFTFTGTMSPTFTVVRISRSKARRSSRLENSWTGAGRERIWYARDRVAGRDRDQRFDESFLSASRWRQARRPGIPS